MTIKRWVSQKLQAKNVFFLFLKFRQDLEAYNIPTRWDQEKQMLPSFSSPKCCMETIFFKPIRWKKFFGHYVGCQKKIFFIKTWKYFKSLKWSKTCKNQVYINFCWYFFTYGPSTAGKNEKFFIKTWKNFKSLKWSKTCKNHVYINFWWYFFKRQCFICLKF